MSIHPSLSESGKKKQRSVLKRTERIKDLMKKGKWDDSSKVFGLAKTKIMRLKVKKAAEKPKEEETAEATQAEVTPAEEKKKSK